VITYLRSRENRRLRSFLFVPGNHPRRIEKALESEADAVVLDLEDAVAETEKTTARLAVSAALLQPRYCAKYVRLNGCDTDRCYGDLISIVRPGLDGIVVPKIESAQHLRTLDWLLIQLEREQGMATGGIDLMPLIETTRSIMALEEICAATPRVQRVAFGAADYAFDLNLMSSNDENELHFARARIAHCSRAAGLDAPIDGIVIQFRDGELFLASAQRARQLGFQGKLCIHPGQIVLVNQIFTPSSEEVAHARKVVAAFDAAEAQGSASIQVDGVFVDYPIAQKARKLIEMMGDVLTDRPVSRPLDHL
jgi:citrate lyase subunit beta/citryl-CoA lyase